MQVNYSSECVDSARCVYSDLLVYLVLMVCLENDLFQTSFPFNQPEQSGTGRVQSLMRYKSLTKWMKWVSDRKRGAGLKEDEATWALQLTTNQARACRQVLIHTANKEHPIVSTLAINAHGHFCLSPSSTVFSVTSLGSISQRSQQLPFFPLTCTTFSGTTLRFSNTNSRPQACTREWE